MCLWEEVSSLSSYSTILLWDLIDSSALFNSVQFSHSVMSNSLQHHESKHTTPYCPSPTPGDHSDSCILSQWCHLAISSSVIPFSTCPQSLPASESFPMSQLFTWGGQSTGVSALVVLIFNNINAFNPWAWYIFPLICVVISLFHQCLIIFSTSL